MTSTESLYFLRWSSPKPKAPPPFGQDALIPIDKAVLLPILNTPPKKIPLYIFYPWMPLLLKILNIKVNGNDKQNWKRVILSPGDI